jgi:hypothetical protein
MRTPNGASIVELLVHVTVAAFDTTDPPEFEMVVSTVSFPALVPEKLKDALPDPFVVAVPVTPSSGPDMTEKVTLVPDAPGVNVAVSVASDPRIAWLAAGDRVMIGGVAEVDAARTYPSVDVKPTAQQFEAVGHDMPSRTRGVPLGRLLVVQVVPPSVVAIIVPLVET